MYDSGVDNLEQGYRMELSSLGELLPSVISYPSKSANNLFLICVNYIYCLWIYLIIFLKIASRTEFLK